MTDKIGLAVYQLFWLSVGWLLCSICWLTIGLAVNTFYWFLVGWLLCSTDWLTIGLAVNKRYWFLVGFLVEYCVVWLTGWLDYCWVGARQTCRGKLRLLPGANLCWRRSVSVATKTYAQTWWVSGAGPPICGLFGCSCCRLLEMAPFPVSLVTNVGSVLASVCSTVVDECLPRRSLWCVWM